MARPTDGLLPRDPPTSLVGVQPLRAVRQPQPPVQADDVSTSEVAVVAGLGGLHADHEAWAVPSPPRPVRGVREALHGRDREPVVGRPAGLDVRTDRPEGNGTHGTPAPTPHRRELPVPHYPPPRGSLGACVAGVGAARLPRLPQDVRARRGGDAWPGRRGRVGVSAAVHTRDRGNLLDPPHRRARDARIRREDRRNQDVRTPARVE